VVYHLKEWVQGNHTVRRRPDDAKGGTMRLGAYDAKLRRARRVARSMARPRSPSATATATRSTAYRDRLEEKGLRFAGMSPDGRLPEIVEWPDHPWFIGVQFHPELKSKPFAPHPLFRRFHAGGGRGQPAGVDTAQGRTMPLPFHIYDVFTDRPYAGNPLAIVEDADEFDGRADAGDCAAVQSGRDDLHPAPGRSGP
jgi:hypothetical protein